jgi:polar amino acid transport system permease protein
MEFNFHFALEILPALLRGAVVTIEATFGGMALALVGGLLLAVGRLSKLPLVPTLCLGYIQFMRNTPLLVQLYFVFYVLPLAGITFDALATGIVGLGLNYSAYTAEVYRAGIQGVAGGQWEAAIALDLSPRQTWTRIILPQAIPPMVPVLGNYLIGMFKDTPLLATITIPEMFGAAEQVAGVTYRYNEPYTLVGLIFLLLSYPASLAVRHLEARTAIARTRD